MNICQQSVNPYTVNKTFLYIYFKLLSIMEILINKLTKDSDLKTGLQVAYKDTYGDFSQTGTIESTYFDDIPLYVVNGAAYAANELKLIAPAKLNTVKVLFADSKYNYSTDVSTKTTEQTAKRYFVGQDFDLGIYPAENMQTCIGIEFTDNNL